VKNKEDLNFALFGEVIIKQSEKKFFKFSSSTVVLQKKIVERFCYYKEIQ